MLSHSYNIVIDGDFGSPGHGKYVVDGLNATYNFFLSVFMTTVQLPGAATNDSQIFVHTSMINTYISISKEF